MVDRTIKLFLIDGEPDGMLTAEIMNWTGHVLYGPRARIVDLLRRPEVQKTGIYLPVGKDPTEADGVLVYVGEGDNVGTHIGSYTLIETARLNDIDREAWLTDIIARVADHPINKIDDLLPWKWKPHAERATPSQAA